MDNIVNILPAGEISNFSDLRNIYKMVKDDTQLSNLVRIGMINDGSSLLHAIAFVKSREYRNGQIRSDNNNIKVINKRNFVKTLRKELASKLDHIVYTEEDVDTDNINKEKEEDIIQTYYGKYFENQGTISQLSTILRSGSSLGTSFYKYIANVLEVNLHIITNSYSKSYWNDTYRDKFTYGETDIENTKYDDKETGEKEIYDIILLNFHNHYELVGTLQSSKIVVNFNKYQGILHKLFKP